MPRLQSEPIRILLISNQVNGKLTINFWLVNTTAGKLKIAYMLCKNRKGNTYKPDNWNTEFFFIQNSFTFLNYTCLSFRRKFKLN